MVHSLTTPTVIWTTVTNVTLPSTFLVSSNDNNVHTSTPLLEQVTLEYIGEYTCTAENEGGEMSDVINVTVYGKNMCGFLHQLFHFFLSTFLQIRLSASANLYLKSH